MPDKIVAHLHYFPFYCQFNYSIAHRLNCGTNWGPVAFEQFITNFYSELIKITLIA